MCNMKSTHHDDDRDWLVQMLGFVVALEKLLHISHRLLLSCVALCSLAMKS